MPLTINGATSGSTTITAPATGSDETIELSTALASKLDLAGGKILQVVSATKTDTFSTSSSSFVDVTGLSVTITPSTNTNKVLVIGSVSLSCNDTDSDGAALQLAGGNASNYLADSAGSRIRSIFAVRRPGGTFGPAAEYQTAAVLYLDSPASNTAQTYKIQARGTDGGTAFINQSGIDTDNATFHRTVSSLVALEVSA
jgi:hypothetical protein